MEGMLEIRDAGAMGKGVFATEAIIDNVVLGEYLGELLPLESGIDFTDSYVFIIEGVALCSKSP